MRLVHWVYILGHSFTAVRDIDVFSGSLPPLEPTPPYTALFLSTSPVFYSTLTSSLSFELLVRTFGSTAFRLALSYVLLRSSGVYLRHCNVLYIHHAWPDRVLRCPRLSGVYLRYSRLAGSCCLYRGCLEFTCFVSGTEKHNRITNKNNIIFLSSSLCSFFLSF